MTKRVLWYALLVLLCCSVSAILVHAAKTTPNGKTAMRPAQSVKPYHNGMNPAKKGLESVTTATPAEQPAVIQQLPAPTPEDIAGRERAARAALDARTDEARTAKKLEAENLARAAEPPVGAEADRAVAAARAAAELNAAPAPTDALSDPAMQEASAAAAKAKTYADMEALLRREQSGGKLTESEKVKLDAYSGSSYRGRDGHLDNTGGPDGGGYIWRNNLGGDTVAYNYVTLYNDVSAARLSFTGGTDDGYATVTFTGGFTFPFYGTTYTSMNVLTNGNIQFGSSSTAYTNTALPYASFTKAICAYWDDLFTTTSGRGGVWVRNFGSYYIVDWDSLSSAYKFEIILYSSGDIRIQYKSGNASGATLGIQGGTAGPQLQYSYNTAISPPLSIKYYIPPAIADNFGTVSVSSPVSGSTYAPGAVVPVNAIFKNFGTTTQSSPVAYKLGTDPAFTGEFTPVLAQNGTDAHSFGTSVTMPLTNGRYVLKVYTDLAADADRGNDTVFVYVKIGCPDYTVNLPAQAPYTTNSTLVGAGDDVCVHNGSCPDGPDEVYQINVTQAGSYTFSLCNTTPTFDTYLRLSATCFGTDSVGCNDDFCGLVSQMSCLPLAVGTYYLGVNTYVSTTSPGPYRLDITQQAASPNDACANAQAVAVAPSGTNNATGTLYTCNTTETFATCNTVAPGYYGVWFTVVGNGNNMTASTCNAGTAFDTRLFVFTGTCTALTCVTANDNDPTPCATLSTLSKVSWCANSGVTYYVCLASGVSGTVGAYQVDFTDTGVDCSVGRCCYGWEADPSAPSCQSPVTIGVCNTLGGVWTSLASCQPPVPPNNNNSCPTYKRGENCYAPFVISSLPYTDAGDSTCGYANDYSYTTLGCVYSYTTTGPDVMYKYVPASNTSINATLTWLATEYYASVSIWDGCPIGTNCIGGAYNYTPNTATATCIPVSAGHTYYIMVDNYPSYEACIHYTLNVTECLPCPTVACDGSTPESEPNGGCLASPVEPFNPVTNGSIIQGSVSSNGTVRDYDGYELAITSAPKNITVIVNPEFDATVQLSFDTVGGTCPDYSTLVTRNANARCVAETLAYTAMFNGLYHIYVYPPLTPALPAANYCMTVQTSAYVGRLGDDCSNPFVISSLPYSDVGDSTCSYQNNFQYSSISCISSLYTDAPDVFFSWTPVTSTAINVSLNSISTYPSVSVWDGCPNVTASNCITGAYTSGSGILNLNCIPTLAGHTYYIMVDDWPAPPCIYYSLTVTECAPCPVTCSGSTPESEPNGGCKTATYEPFNPVTNGSVKLGNVTSDGSIRDFDGYELAVTTPPENITVVVNPAEFDATVELAFDTVGGSCPDNTSLVVMNNAGRCGTETISFDATAAGLYHIYVYPALTPALPAPTNYCMTVTTTSGTAPGNDACANAYGVSVPSSTFGTTRFAAADYPGDAVYCGSYAYGPGVWYTVEGNGDTLFASLCASANLWNSKISVYTGTCGSLTCYASNDDACSASGHAKVSFCSQMGVTYYILVFSSTAGLSGDFTLDITSGGACRPCASCAPENVDLGTIGTTTWGYFVTDSCWFGGKWVGKFNATTGDHFHFDLCPATPGTGSVGFYSPSTGFDPDIKILDASCTILTGEDGSCTGGINSYQPNDFQWSPTTSGTYYVIIAPYSSYSSHTCTGAASQYFTMNYYREQCLPLPPNDECASVTPVNLPLDGTVITFTGDNTCATPDCPSFALGEGNAWVAFILGTQATVKLNYCGTSPYFGDAWLNLTDCPCTGFTFAATWTYCNAPLDSNVSMQWADLPAGTYYYPVLREVATHSRGAYTINVKVVPCDTVVDLRVYQAPAPDTTKARLIWSGNTTGGYRIYKTASWPPFEDVGNLVGEVAGVALPNPTTWIDPDDSWTLAYYLVVHDCAMHLGRCCYGTDSCTTNTSAECVTLGGTWVAGASCPCPVAGTGDECTSAIVITNGVPITMDYSTATPLYGVGTETMGLTVYGSLWFAYTATATSTVTASTCFPETSFDTVVGYFTVCGGTLVGYDDDGCSTYTVPDTYHPSILTFSATSGVTYYICVAAWSSANNAPPTTPTLIAKLSVTQ